MDTARTRGPVEPVRLAIALLPPLVALVVQWALWGLIQPYVWFLFYPAVFLSSWIGGRRAGMIATVIATVLVWWFFVAPERTLVKHPRQLFPAGVFLTMGAFFAVFHDRLRRAREETEALNRGLVQANQRITQLYQKTKELDELKSQFFANVSHELRTPLTLILGPVERHLAEDSQIEPELREDLQVVERNARTLLRHVNDLLDVARIDAGRVAPEYAEVDAAALVRFASDHFSALAQETGIELEVDAPAGLPVQIDREKLQRILLNLLSNAFKFTPPGGRVRVSLRREGDRLWLEVADSGPGIPEAEQVAVFERFHQLERGATRRFGGTGLGLSIVKEFATLLGGGVSVAKAPEGGALFVLDLPCVAPIGASVVAAPVERAWAREVEHMVAELSPAPRSGCAVAEGGALVLVVEDNHDMSAFIADSLERDGFRVALAFDGRDGYQKAIETRPDLVLTDVMMPEMSGDELVRALRQKVDASSMPIVVLTAKADDELRVRLLREGAQDYLTKPFSAAELCARVSNLTARKLAEERSHRLREQVEEVAHASMSVSDAVAALPDTSVRAVLETIALNARNLVSAEYAAVGMGRDPTRPFDTWSFAGLSHERALEIGPHPRPVGLLGLVRTENKSVRLRDLREHPAHRGFPANHPVMTGFLGVPIRFRGEAVGTLYLANKRGALEFSEQDQRLVEMLAARAGGAIETARLYATEGMERAWLQAVVDQMPEGVVLMDAEGRVTVENGAVQSLAAEAPYQHDRYGNPMTLDFRHSSGERLSPEELPLEQAMTHRRATHGLELWVRPADGRMVPVLVSAAPVRSAAGELAGATMVVQDISALKELERLREEWASIVAHDLQQPISTMLLRSDLLLRSELGDRQKKDVGHLRAAAERMSRMVSDLMDASKLEARRMQISRSRLDLGELVCEVVERVPDASARIRVRTPEGRRLFVLGDAQRLEQVLTNLLTNAVKYGARDAEILVEVDETRDEAQVAVVNRGPGISADALTRIFDRYVRSERATAAASGSGLGLYIAKGLVEAHGGRIWAESVPGELTTFRFSIPLDRAAAPRAMSEALAH